MLMLQELQCKQYDGQFTTDINIHKLC